MSPSPRYIAAALFGLVPGVMLAWAFLDPSEYWLVALAGAVGVAGAIYIATD